MNRLAEKMTEEMEIDRKEEREEVKGGEGK
jgi:hypothetical protein